MGRMHKKRMSEYVEAAENGDNQKKTVKENEANAGDLGTAEATGRKSNDSEETQSDTENPSEKDNGNGNEKRASKRKTVQKAVAANGENSENPPTETSHLPKRGRRTTAGKAKIKHSKGGRGNDTKKTTIVEEENGSDEEEYEVKDIVGHKIQRGTTFYLIRWKGYTKDSDTWEAEETLSCPDIIAKYLKKTAPKKAKLPAGKKAAKNNIEKKKPIEDPNKEWEVEKIINYAVEKNGRVFRIRWKGFGPKNDTWEPEKNLHCSDLIEKFMKRMESQKDISFKQLREGPKKTKRLVNETAPRTSYHNPIGRKSKRAVSKIRNTKAAKH